MTEGFEHIDDLIAKALAGEADAAEMETLRAWRKSHAANEAYYNDSEKLFRAVDDARGGLEVNEDAAWQKLQHNMDKGAAGNRIIPFYRQANVLRAAAGIALLVALVAVSRWFLGREELPPLVLSSASRPKTEKLPDGSKVVMNKNTELTYSINPRGERMVALKGEAYFDVQHDAKKPFIIEAGEVMIRDIGTAFNVKAFPGTGLVEVVVEKGEVQFYSGNNIGVNLKKGEKATYDRSNRHFTKMLPTPTENPGAYRSMRFEFRDTPLRDVIAQLNASCPMMVQLQDKDLGDLRLSVLFRHEEPEAMIEVIAETFDLQVERNDSLFILKRKPVQ